LTALLLIVLNAQSWGLLLGGLFMDPKTAQAVTTVVMLSFLLVSGFYVRDVPIWIGWIKCAPASAAAAAAAAAANLSGCSTFTYCLVVLVYMGHR
jgi:hypothetical protein